MKSIIIIICLQTKGQKRSEVGHEELWRLSWLAMITCSEDKNADFAMTNVAVAELCQFFYSMYLIHKNYTDNMALLLPIVCSVSDLLASVTWWHCFNI